MAIKLSERAAEEVQRFRTEHNFGEEMVLRIGVAGGGCSGFNYTLNFDDSFDEKADSKYECHGVAVVVDKKERSVSRWHDRRLVRKPGKTGLHVRKPQRREDLRLR